MKGKNITKRERRDLFSLEISCISRNVTGGEILSLLVDNFAITEVKTVNTFVRDETPPIFQW